MVCIVFGNAVVDIELKFSIICPGILVMFAVFLHPIGWGAKRVVAMCGPDSESFYPAECSIGKFLK